MRNTASDLRSAWLHCAHLPARVPTRSVAMLLRYVSAAVSTKAAAGRQQTGPPAAKGKPAGARIQWAAARCPRSRTAAAVAAL